MGCLARYWLGGTLRRRRLEIQWQMNSVPTLSDTNLLPFLICRDLLTYSPRGSRGLFQTFTVLSGSDGSSWGPNSNTNPGL